MISNYEEYLGSLAFRYLLDNDKIPLDAALDSRRTQVGDLYVHLGIISGGQVHTHHVSSWELLVFLDRQQRELVQLVRTRMDNLEKRVVIHERQKPSEG
jgi:hypothetical protein